MIFLKNVVDFMVKANISLMELPVWETFELKDSKLIKCILGDRVGCYSVHFPKTIRISKLLIQENFIEAVNDLSPEIVVVHPESGNDFLNSVDRLQERLMNSIVTIEYLPYKSDIKDLLESMDCHYTITLDIYHCLAACVDWRDCIRHFGTRIKHIHLRNIRRETDNDYNYLHGIESIDFNHLLFELNEIDYQGVLMYESKIVDEFEALELFSQLGGRKPYETGDGIYQ